MGASARTLAVFATTVGTLSSLITLTAGPALARGTGHAPPSVTMVGCALPGRRHARRRRHRRGEPADRERGPGGVSQHRRKVRWLPGHRAGPRPAPPGAAAVRGASCLPHDRGRASLRPSGQGSRGRKPGGAAAPGCRTGSVADVGHYVTVAGASATGISGIERKHRHTRGCPNPTCPADSIGPRSQRAMGQGAKVLPPWG